MPQIWRKSSSSKASLIPEDEFIEHTPNPFTAENTNAGSQPPSEPQPLNVNRAYRLHKRRFAGLFGLFMLNAVAAMSLPWFGPISHTTAQEFNISISQVNWLANSISCVYVPATLLTPWIVSNYGVRRCCQAGAVCLLVSAWVRYAGTAPDLPSEGVYALLIAGQIISAVAQAIYQVLAPKYSETWFNQNGRTTATMIVAISNPIGGAVGQVISPLVGTVSRSILILAIASSAVIPLVFLIGDKPPTPPTASATQETKSLTSLVLDIIEKVDFLILLAGFAANISVINTFSILSGQDLTLYGYDDSVSGLMGATLVLAGIICAGIMSPLVDRVFINRAGILIRILSPSIAAAWISLIWAIRPNNALALFVIFGFIGACGVTLLPIALEMAVELTGSADASSALMWCVGSAFTIVFILVETQLQAGPDGSPPFNTKNGLIFQACVVGGFSILMIPFKGEQKRRLQDDKNAAAARANVYSIREPNSSTEEQNDSGVRLKSIGV